MHAKTFCTSEPKCVIIPKMETWDWCISAQDGPTHLTHIFSDYILVFIFSHWMICNALPFDDKALTIIQIITRLTFRYTIMISDTGKTLEIRLKWAIIVELNGISFSSECVVKNSCTVADGEWIPDNGSGMAFIQCLALFRVTSYVLDLFKDTTAVWMQSISVNLTENKKKNWSRTFTGAASYMH